MVQTGKNSECQDGVSWSAAVQDRHEQCCVGHHDGLLYCEPCSMLLDMMGQRHVDICKQVVRVYSLCAVPPKASVDLAALA